MKFNEYLHKENLTASEFAVKAGVSAQVIYKIKNGQRISKSMALLVHIATGKEVTMEELRGKNEP